MTNMQVLARLLTELEDQLQACRRCGRCRSVCPLFAETGREADVARGKLALLDGLRRQLFQHPKGVMARLERCLLCGSCAAQCPSGVKVLEIFIRARLILAGYLRLSPLKKILLRGLLSRPHLTHRLLNWGAKLQGFFVRPVNDLLASASSPYLSPLLHGRHFRPLAAVPFHRRINSHPTSGQAGKPRVALFIGCLIDKIFPEIGQAVLRIMAHHQVGVFVPSNQGCCGMPALAAGDAVTFLRLVSHHLACFTAEDFDYLVTPCSTCAFSLKFLWPLMASNLPTSQQSRLAHLTAMTLDIHQFLVDVLGLEGARPEGAEDEKIRVAYHDPCHLKKSLGVTAQPRTLLAANPGYRLVELAEGDWCCGSGGTFSLKHYEISANIGRRKLNHILQAHCDVVATACPACMLQLIDLLSQAQVPIRVKHTTEIYADSLP